MIFLKDVGISLGGVLDWLKSKIDFFYLNRVRMTKIYYSIMKNFMKYLSIFSSLFVSVAYISAAELPSVDDIQALESMKLGKSVVEESQYKEIQTSTQKVEEVCEDCIFGYDFFKSTPTTFALSSNVPIPVDYTLGPGDKILVEFFGNNSKEQEGYISRLGTFNLPLLGPISLAGLKFSKAEELIRKKASQELIGTDVYLSLSEMRSINVYVVGAAYNPGTYTVSSLASLTNVILASGGPGQQGSLRNIQVKRNGSLINSYDFYDLILKGDTSKDIRLQESDAVFFPLIENKVRVDGSVQRPGFYEIKEGETVDDILSYAGIENNQDLKVQFSRYKKDTKERIVQMLQDNDATRKIILKNGDSINIITSSSIKPLHVEVTGEVLYPGYYDVNPGETILGVITNAGGMTNQAYPEASVFTRLSVAEQQKSSYMKNADNLEKSLIDAVSSGSTIDGDSYLAISAFIERLRAIEPLGRQVVSVDSYTLNSDPKYNFELQDGDKLVIPKRTSVINVVGEVLNSTTHIFDQDLSVQDYIELSGGVTDGADLSKIFVIMPNGQAVLYKKRLFQDDISNNLLPGSTVVVSRNPNPFNWLGLTALITPILSDLAVSAAAIAAISDNN
jgi:polysaccharide biosynthesis/export protein